MIDKQNVIAFDPLEPSRHLTRAAEKLKPGLALDVGCGIGKHAIWLAKQGWEVDAFDPSEESLNIARDRAAEIDITISFSEADISTFQFDRLYDLVVCAMILHFFDDEQITASIEKMKKWVKPGGNIYISVMNDQNPEGKRPKLFKKGELEHYFTDWHIISSYQTETGFVIMPGKSKPETFYFDYLVAAKP